MSSSKPPKPPAPPTPELRYDKMVEKALRGVIADAVRHVIKNGLPDDHHFYITFQTKHDGVQIPSYLREQYTDEMTIVLQYQFYGLEVDAEKMAVTLSFNNVPERLVIPLEAITIFADPSVNFALQFQPMDDFDDFDDEDLPPPPPSTKADKEKKPKTTSDSANKVVALDAFRKK